MQLNVCPISYDKQNNRRREKQRDSKIRKQFNGGQWWCVSVPDRWTIQKKIFGKKA